MLVRIEPGGALSGVIDVPGDKSIAHRWLMLAATARGSSRIDGIPLSLDVMSTARCLAAVSDKAKSQLEGWLAKASSLQKTDGSTWNTHGPALGVEGDGRSGLLEPAVALDCGNSGTTMRLLSGILAPAPLHATLLGDESLNRRPMRRVADPLNQMGAQVTTTDGHAPVDIVGQALTGIDLLLDVPSAQVKSAVLLAGLMAEGTTSVTEPVGSRDHTERALRALGAPVSVEGTKVTVSAFQHDGLEGTVPGDASSAAFLVAAAGLTGSELTITGVGLNPSRIHFLRVFDQMGIRTEVSVEAEELGEPTGSITVLPGTGITSVTLDEQVTPLVIDEVPMLGLLAAHAEGPSRFLGAGELRHKESDRLEAIARGIRDLGGDARAEGDILEVAGGGLNGGRADAAGDHRMAMAFAVSALRARSASHVADMGSADVSFPGFIPLMRSLGAHLEVER